MMRYAGKMMVEAVDSSCILLQDALSFLASHHGSSLKFAHTETIFPLLAHIGYLNQPMTSSSNRLNRQFFGDITPFAGNFFLVAQQCEGEVERVVEVFLNEKVIEIPGCGTPCTVGRLREMFPEEECKFTEVCEGSWWDRFRIRDHLTIELAIVSIIFVVFIDLIYKCFT